MKIGDWKCKLAVIHTIATADASAFEHWKQKCQNKNCIAKTCCYVNYVAATLTN
jgi:hypothetical protein